MSISPAISSGALVAAELAITRPQLIRRVLLWGVPSYSAQASRRASAETCRRWARVKTVATCRRSGVEFSSVADRARPSVL